MESSRAFNIKSQHPSSILYNEDSRGELGRCSYEEEEEGLTARRTIDYSQPVGYHINRFNLKDYPNHLPSASKSSINRLLHTFSFKKLFGIVSTVNNQSSMVVPLYLSLRPQHSVLPLLVKKQIITKVGFTFPRKSDWNVYRSDCCIDADDSVAATAALDRGTRMDLP